MNTNSRTFNANATNATVPQPNLLTPVDERAGDWASSTLSALTPQEPQVVEVTEVTETYPIPDNYTTAPTTASTVFPPASSSTIPAAPTTAPVAASTTTTTAAVAPVPDAPAAAPSTIFPPATSNASAPLTAPPPTSGSMIYESTAPLGLPGKLAVEHDNVTGPKYNASSMDTYAPSGPEFSYENGTSNAQEAAGNLVEEVKEVAVAAVDTVKNVIVPTVASILPSAQTTKDVAATAGNGAIYAGVTAGQTLASAGSAAVETTKEAHPIETAKEYVHGATDVIRDYVVAPVAAYLPGHNDTTSAPLPAPYREDRTGVPEELAPALRNEHTAVAPKDTPSSAFNTETRGHKIDKVGVAAIVEQKATSDRAAVGLEEVDAISRPVDTTAKHPAVGDLPGTPSETGVAVLPDEKQQKSTGGPKALISAVPGAGKDTTAVHPAVGNLPGGPGETGVAVLPDEKKHNTTAAPKSLFVAGVPAGASDDASIRSLAGSRQNTSTTLGTSTGVPQSYTAETLGHDGNQHPIGERDMTDLHKPSIMPAPTPANTTTSSSKLHGHAAPSSTKSTPAPKHTPASKINEANPAPGHHPADKLTSTAPVPVLNGVIGAPAGGSSLAGPTVDGHAHGLTKEEQKAFERPEESHVDRKNREEAQERGGRSAVGSNLGSSSHSSQGPAVPPKDTGDRMAAPILNPHTDHQGRLNHDRNRVQDTTRANTLANAHIGGADEPSAASTLGSHRPSSHHDYAAEHNASSRGHSRDLGATHSHASGASGASSASSKKPSLMDKVKGEVKVISGKMGHNEHKVEEGKRLMGKRLN